MIYIRLILTKYLFYLLYKFRLNEWGVNIYVTKRDIVYY
jgi:hypothetical protein